MTYINFCFYLHHPLKRYKRTLVANQPSSEKPRLFPTSDSSNLSFRRLVEIWGMQNKNTYLRFSEIPVSHLVHLFPTLLNPVDIELAEPKLYHRKSTNKFYINFSNLNFVTFIFGKAQLKRYHVKFLEKFRYWYRWRCNGYNFISRWPKMLLLYDQDYSIKIENKTSFRKKIRCESKTLQPVISKHVLSLTRSFNLFSGSLPILF